MLLEAHLVAHGLEVPLELLGFGRLKRQIGLQLGGLLGRILALLPGRRSLHRLALGQFAQETGDFAEIGPFFLVNGQFHIHLLRSTGIRERSGLQMCGVELDGRQRGAALVDLQYGVAGMLHSGGSAIPTDLQLSFTIDGAEF